MDSAAGYRARPRRAEPPRVVVRLRLLTLVYERHQVVEIGPGGLRGGGESFRWGVRSIYPERAIAVDAGADRVPTTVRAERDLCARHSECGRTHLLGAWIGFERSDTISAQVSVENATQTGVLHPGVEHDRVASDRNASRSQRPLSSRNAGGTSGHAFSSSHAAISR